MRHIVKLVLISLCMVISGPGAWAQGDCVPPAPGIIHWWSGDGDSTDIVGTADGTVINGAGYGAGRVGMSFLTDGIDDYVDLGNPATLSFGTDGDFSLDAWVNPEDFIPVNDPGSSIILEKHLFGDSNAAFVLVLNSAGIVIASFRDTQNESFGVSSDPQSLVAGEWSHVALTLDRDDLMVLFVNGEMVGSTDISDLDDITNNVEMTIAGPRAANAHGYHNAMNGKVDEVAVFGRELCPHEVKAIFDAGSEGRCKTPETAIYSSGFECGDLRVWKASPGN